MQLRLLPLYLNTSHTAHQLICSVSWCDLFFMRATHKCRERLLQMHRCVFMENVLQLVMISMLLLTSTDIIHMLAGCSRAGVAVPRPSSACVSSCFPHLSTPDVPLLDAVDPPPSRCVAPLPCVPFFCICFRKPSFCLFVLSFSNLSSIPVCSLG